MGTTFYVACRDCKCARDLDKFSVLPIKADTRQQVLDLATELQKPQWSFRSALLLSFLWKHSGHNCTVFSEHDDDFSGLVSRPGEQPEYSEDGDTFWRPCEIV